MFKVILIAKKRSDLSYEEFRSYYSGHHVPMMNSMLQHGAAVHRRNFVVHPDPANPGDFDVITEVFYEDRDAAEATFAEMAKPELQRCRVEDEERFLDTGSIKIFVVETEETVFRPLW